MARAELAQLSQTVDRALSLLEAFTPEESARTLTSLAEATGLTAPTAHRLLKTLERRGYVVTNPDTRLWRLGPAVFRFASVAVQRDDIEVLVVPVLERLRLLTGETVALHWLVDDRRTCVIELPSRHPIRMTSGIGRVYPLYAGASGKAMLAFLPEAHQHRILDRAPDMSAASRSVLLQDLQEIRRNRCARSHGEVVEGASALAVPLLDADGAPFAAINITGPDTRWNEAAMDQCMDSVMASQEAIQQLVGTQRDHVAHS